MIPLLADEDVNGRIVRGLRRRVSALDLLTVAAAGLRGEDDPVVLLWAAENARVVLTHDASTMPVAALERILQGHSFPGLIVVPQRLGIGVAIAELEVIALCGEPRDFEGQVVYLPL